jgi:hypothetical protein
MPVLYFPTLPLYIVVVVINLRNALSTVCFLLLSAELALFGAIVCPMPFVMKKKSVQSALVTSLHIVLLYYIRNAEC